MGRTLAQSVLVLGFGAFVAVSAFLLTSQSPGEYLRTTSPGACTYGEMREIPPGFDPWTGKPHGWPFLCDEGQPYAGVAADETSTRRAVSLPIGFVLGGAAMIALLYFQPRLQGGRRVRTNGLIP